jgi:hypothetical protein
LCSDFDKKVLRNVQKIMKGVTIWEHLKKVV